MTIHATKLHLPRPRATWIQRARLATLLDRALLAEHRLILVSAPAGAGKTTLIGHWLAERPRTTAWLSLDAEDDEPLRFWTCVLHALQHAVPDLADWMLSALKAPAPPPFTSLLPDLLNEIGRLPEPLLLVLDDYHLISAKGIHDRIVAVVDHLPSTLHLVFCTRADPPLPLARWRARGELVEVRAADLRFTAPEAGVFLNERMALHLTTGEVDQLVARTEGWAAGLHLAALSLQGHADPHHAIQSFGGSRQFMLEYLLEEVLARQSPAVQRFLLATSILKRMCGPLCDAITGESQGAETLAALQRQNLFVIPLDEERCWYRYHHLFGDLLRSRLQQTTPGDIAGYHLRASCWCEQNGAPVEAVQHALAACDWDRAAGLLEMHEEEWWTGSDVSVMNLLPYLPDEVILRGPNLSVYKAWFLLIRGQLADAAALLAEVAARLAATAAEPGNSADHRALRSFVTLQQAYIAELSGAAEVQPVDAASLRAIPESRGGMRNSAEVILAYLLYRAGKLTDAAPFLQATMARDLRTGATNGLAISAARLGRVYVAAGRHHEAADLCDRCRLLIEERGPWRFFVAGNPNIVLGDVLCEWNRLTEAEAAVRAGIAGNDPWQIAHAYALGYSALSRVLLARGDLEGAAAALARQAELTSGRTAPPDLAAETRAVQLRLWIAADDRQAVAAWAGAWAHAAVAPAGFRHAQDQITLARAWLALGRAQEALVLLNRLSASIPVDELPRCHAELLLLSAVAQHMLGEQAKACAALLKSLALATPMSCLRLYLDEGTTGVALVAALGRPHDMPPAVQGFTQQILAAAPASAAVVKPLSPTAMRAVTVPKVGQLVEPLTARELEVLALLAAGCSNQEIAARLVVTLHAVKKHTGSIYGKLGVGSRTQAMVRARELGLVT